MSRAQRLIRGAAMLVLVLAAGPGRTDEAQFDVFFEGIRIGVFARTQAVSTRAYTTSVAFAGTGLVAALTDIRVSMQATGRIAGGVFRPELFQEDVLLGNRRSDARLSYENGTPRLTGGLLGAAQAEVLDPADQGDTVDPATLLLIAARDQPRATLCRVDQAVFDGARRTRLILDAARSDGDLVICEGRFLRLGGYSQRQLRHGRSVAVTLSYAPRAI